MITNANYNNYFTITMTVILWASFNLFQISNLIFKLYLIYFNLNYHQLYIETYFLNYHAYFFCSIIIKYFHCCHPHFQISENVKDFEVDELIVEDITTFSKQTFFY